MSTPFVDRWNTPPTNAEENVPYVAIALTPLASPDTERSELLHTGKAASGRRGGSWSARDPSPAPRPIATASSRTLDASWLVTRARTPGPGACSG